MYIAVISDLHIGSGGRADLFGHEEARFLTFLRRLERSFDRIVLLGDIYETLAAARPYDAAAELKRCREAHPVVAKRFQRSCYQTVVGNHDLVLAREGVPAEWSLKADGKRIVFTHGHLYDRMLAQARHVAELAPWMGGMLCRAGLAGVRTMFDKLDVALRAGADAARCPFQRWAVGYAARQRADIVVTGHTHLGGTARHGARMYLNSGSCENGRFELLAMDTKADLYEHRVGF